MMKERNIEWNKPFLGCEEVSVQFFDQKKPVLQNINLTIAENESVLLLGPSGCGKSTLLQVLSGIIPKSIEAWMKGIVTRPERVGVMFQDPDAQFCMLTVADEIAFSLENRQVPHAQMQERILELMREVRLDVPPQFPVNDLSGGLKQRLALACLLALEPDVLFFDEPTAQLDPENTRQVLADIRRWHGRKTLVLIEHKLDGVIDWVDRVLLFGPDGRLIDDGAPQAVLQAQAGLMREYGIWQPRLWPVTWDEVLAESGHPLATGWERQLAEAAEQVHREQEQGVQHVQEQEVPLLEVRDAALGYAKAGEPVWSAVNVQVRPGEWVAVMGPNGAGKSTFLKAVGGLLPLRHGQILFKQKPLEKYKSDVLHDQVGFVFQNPEHQFIADTVFEEVAFGGRLARWPQERVLAETNHLLDDFHLLEWQEKNPFALSQGQKRRLSVAGMLLKRQELLLLDEPTFGQDAATTAELLERLQQRNRQGMTILMATHDVELVTAYATRVLVFAEQGLLYDGTPHELFLQPEMLRRASLTAPLAYEYRERLMNRTGGGIEYAGTR